MGVRSIHADWGQALAGLVLAAALSACAPKKVEKNYVGECILPTDQAKTLAGRWALAPIPIALQGAKFSAEEVTAIQAAADAWNDFSGATIQVALLDYGSKEGYNTSTSASPSSAGSCGSRILVDLGEGPIYKGAVTIYKQRAWPASYSGDAIALTSTCGRVENGLNGYYAGTVELNYQNFFTPGKKIPDLQTIVTHELGHLIGLDHSCSGSGKKGMPACNSAEINPDYVSAVMFPVFYFDTFGNGEFKRDLNVNDQGRANCLYQETEEE
jgi:hypothetical protein